MKHSSFLFFLLLLLINILLIHTVVFSETDAPVLTHELHSEIFIPKLTPEGDFGNRIKEKVKTQNANSASEFLHKFNIANNLLEGLTDDEIDLAILQTLFLVDSQKGIQYYSNSKKEYQTFFTDIYRIQSVEDKRPLENLSIGKLEDTISSLIFTKDNSYGRLVFQYNVYYDNGFYLTLTNKVRAYYKIFFFVGPPDTIHTQYIIQRDGSMISVYGISFLKSSTFKSIRIRASKSSLYRMYSVVQWLESEVENSLRKLQNN